MSTILAHDSATASLFAGFLDSIQRDPDGWEWPTGTGDYLRCRIATFALELLLDGANVAVTA